MNRGDGMDRLTQRIEGKVEMLCRFEDCEITDDICPGCNRDECLCLQQVLDKLKTYEDAEEQGLLLRLPCKVGDTVYQIHTLPRSNRKVLAQVEVDAFFISLCLLEGRFGKTVFLAREEAEKALADMGV